MAAYPTSCEEAGNATDAPRFVRGLMLFIGKTLSVWSRLAALTQMGGPPERWGGHDLGMDGNDPLVSGEAVSALVSAYLGLLRALMASAAWWDCIAECVREVGAASVLVFRRGDWEAFTSLLHIRYKHDESDIAASEGGHEVLNSTRLLLLRTGS